VTEARVDSLIPPYFRPDSWASHPFWHYCSEAAGFRCAAGTHARDTKRQRELARTQLIRTLLERMAAASSAGNAAAFLSTARSALQQALSARWEVEPEQIAEDSSTRGWKARQGRHPPNFHSRG